MNNVKLAVHGSYFSDNFGDTLLVKLICDRFAEKVGRDNVLLAQEGHEGEQKSIGYRLATSGEIKNVTHLAYAGGGYFGEPSGSFLSRLSWTLRNYQRHLRWLPKYKHTKKGVFGVGVGPISSRILRAKFRRLAASSEILLVRDNESYKYCLNYGVQESRIDQCVDLALSIKDSFPETQKFRLALHLTGMSEHTLSVIYQFIEKNKDKLTSKNLTLNVIVDGSGDNVKSSAIKNTEILKELAPGLEIDFLPYTEHTELLQILNECAVVITAKLHVGICSISLGAKVVSIPVHSKTQRLYKQLGISDFCFYRRNDQLNQEALENLIFSRSFNPDWSVVNIGLEKLENAINSFIGASNEVKS